MDHKQFRQLVTEMRNAQKMYFRNRSSEYLSQSKKLERMVDDAIREEEKLDREPVLPFLFK